MDVSAPTCEFSILDKNFSAEEIKTEDNENESCAKNIEYIEWGEPSIEEFIVPHEQPQNDVFPTNEIFATKKRKKNPSLWKTNLRRQKRESGQMYMSTKNKIVPGRALKKTCSNCIFDCTNIFSAEERVQIFDSFWRLSDDEKNSFYSTFVSRDCVRRRKKDCDSSIKQFSYKYYLEKNQSLHRVCRVFFLNTLSIDQKRIYYSFTHLKNNSISPKEGRSETTFKRVAVLDKTSESQSISFSSSPGACSQNSSESTPTANETLSPKINKKSLALQRPKIELEQAYISSANELELDRDLKESCTSCSFKCANRFSAEERTNIFQSFWSLSDDEKSSFYNRFVTRDYVKRRRRNSKSFIKQYTYKYFLEKNQSMHRVCRVFFLNTLSIDQKRIYYCFKHLRMKDKGYLLQRRIKNAIKRVAAAEVKSEIQEEILSSPEVGSHYYRTKVHSGSESLLPRKRKINTPLWKINLRKLKREPEQTYVSTIKEMVPGRALKKPCNTCPYSCANIFSTEDRIIIFQSFWSLSGDEKLNFYKKFVIRDNVRRRKKNSRSDIKQFSYKYFLEKNQSLYRVCRVFFLNTLCIDQKRIYYSFKHLKDRATGFPLGRSNGKPVKRFTATEKTTKIEELRRSNGKSVKSFTTPKTTAKIEEHLLSISAVRSHYCSASVRSITETSIKEGRANPLLCNSTLRKQNQESDQTIGSTKSKLVAGKDIKETILKYNSEFEQVLIDATKSEIVASRDIKELMPIVSTKIEVAIDKDIRKRIPKQRNASGEATTKNQIFTTRNIKEPCKTCPFDCSNIFSTEERINIFQSFWSLSGDEKTSFYNNFVIRDNVKRRKKDSQSDIKQFSYKYFLEKNQSLHRVCRVFFLHTLSIDQKRIYYSFNHLRNKDADPLL